MANKNIKEFLLKNGFRVIVKKDHRSPMVAFQICYKVGSAFDPLGLTGISHALEHMMFRGSLRFNSKKTSKLNSEHGANQNAFTGQDYTNYHQLIVRDKLEECIRKESDRMSNLLLRKKDFDMEKKIILEERRLTVEDNPKQSIYERFLATSHQTGPYHHLAIGSMNDIKNIVLSDVRKWYQRWYVPNNAFGVVVGDVSNHQIVTLFKKYFEPIPPGVLPSLNHPIDGMPLEMRTISFKHPMKHPSIVLGFNVPVINTSKYKWEPYALMLLGEILAGGKTARLCEQFITNKPLLLDIQYLYSPIKRFDTTLSFMITPRITENLNKLTRQILFEIKKLTKHRVTIKELERIKTKIYAERIYQSDSITYQADEISSFEGGDISWREIDHAYKMIDSITAEQIKKVACTYLTNDRLTIVASSATATGEQ